MIVTPQKYFPYLPDYSTWEEFNGNLILFYGETNLGTSTEENWRDTVNGLSAIFSVYPVPGPETYENWQDWARAFIVAVNGSSK